MAKGRAKQPTNRERPQARKTPKFRDPEFRGGHLAWRFSMADNLGRWPWADLSGDDHVTVVQKLASFEQLHPHEITQAGSHAIARDALCTDAQRRLEELGNDDVDEVMSFSLTNTNRVICIPDGAIMRVLWWDPNHEVCPSEKKHT